MGTDIFYAQWKKDYEKILAEFPQKRVFLLYSGGKDSSLVMDFLAAAAVEYGFKFEAHAGAFPVHRYTQAEKDRLDAYWNSRGVHITWHDLGETDDHISGAQNPCLPCQKLRKVVLKDLLSETVQDWQRLVLVTSYSLWDIVSYAVEHLLAEIFSDSPSAENPQNSTRFIETAQRYYPLLRMKEGYTVLRPIIKYNGSHIVTFIREKGIPILSIPCAFRGFRPKRILEKYYDDMGLHFHYSRVFDFARKSLNLPDIASYEAIDKDKYLSDVL